MGTTTMKLTVKEKRVQEEFKEALQLLLFVTDGNTPALNKVGEDLDEVHAVLVDLNNDLRKNFLPRVNKTRVQVK